MSDYSSSQNQNFSQSASFAQALQRAKQIAAKIQPNQQGQKRSIEDSQDSESKKFGGSDYGSNASSPNAMSPAAMQAAAQAAQAVVARLAQSNPNNPPQHNSSTGAVSPQDAVQRARELINKMVHQNPQQQQNGNRAGFGSQQQHQQNSNNFQQPYTEIMIPGSKVGLVIGKGGETIKQLQEKTGAKMVVIQDGPGQEMEKPLRISGDPDKVEHAKQLVYELIQDKEQGQFQPRQQQFNSGGEQFEIFVPKAAVGVVIGKGGDMIKKIQGETGCKLQFIQGKGDGPGDRRCIVQGSKQQVDDGKQMIEELIESVLRRNNEGGGYRGGGGQGQGGNQGGNQGGQGQDNAYSNYSGPSVVREEYQFTVPASKCGIIIGRGGDTIKQINQQSGAHCEMDRKVSASQTSEKTFSIKGEQHQIDEAKRLIQDKINLELELTHVGSQTVPASQAYGGGGGGGQNAYGAQSWGGYAQQSWDPQQAAAAQIVANVQQGGQPDYSQQWIDYYKQMGMMREAEMIEQQVKARQAGAATTATPMMPQQQQPQQQQPAAQNGAQAGAAASAQADYSAEWAEYYRSIGKLQEAEAIEKQIQANKMQAGAAGGAYAANVMQAAAANPQMAGGYAQYQQYYAAAGGQPAQQQQPAYPNYGQYAGQYGQGQNAGGGGGGNDNKN